MLARELCGGGEEKGGGRIDREEIGGSGRVRKMVGVVVS